MKYFVIAVCLFGLAVAFPKGGDKGGDGKKPNPMRGLVKLCASLADAAADEKRDFDFDAALVDICGYVLSEAMKKEEEQANEERDFEDLLERAMKGGKGEKGERPEGAKGEKDDSTDEEKDIVDVLVKICGGFAKMAEKVDKEARQISTKEEFMAAMKLVCEAAKAEADAAEE